MKRKCIKCKILNILTLLIIFLTLSSCSYSYWEKYSGDPSEVNCYRKKIQEDKALVAVKIKGEDYYTSIPFLWKSWIEKSPYSVIFAVTTDNPIYDHVIIHSAILITESGDKYHLIEKGRDLFLPFSLEDYSTYAMGKAYQAFVEFSQKVYVDYSSIKKIDILIEMSLVLEDNKSLINVSAPFYALTEKEVIPLYLRYTN